MNEEYKPLESNQMEEAGFQYDPTWSGRLRWTHITTRITALRQPFMDHAQWNEHRREKIEEAKQLEKQP